MPQQRVFSKCAFTHPRNDIGGFPPRPWNRQVLTALVDFAFRRRGLPGSVSRVRLRKNTEQNERQACDPPEAAHFLCALLASGVGAQPRAGPGRGLVRSRRSAGRAAGRPVDARPGCGRAARRPRGRAGRASGARARRDRRFLRGPRLRAVLDRAGQRPGRARWLRRSTPAVRRRCRRRATTRDGAGHAVRSRRQPPPRRAARRRRSPRTCASRPTCRPACWSPRQSTRTSPGDLCGRRRRLLLAGLDSAPLPGGAAGPRARAIPTTAG